MTVRTVTKSEIAITHKWAVSTIWATGRSDAFWLFLCCGRSARWSKASHSISRLSVATRGARVRATEVKTSGLSQSRKLLVSVAEFGINYLFFLGIRSKGRPQKLTALRNHCTKWKSIQSSWNIPEAAWIFIKFHERNICYQIYDGKYRFFIRFLQNRDLSCVWQCKHDRAFSEQIQRRSKVTWTESANDVQIMTEKCAQWNSKQRKREHQKMGKFWDKGFAKFVRKTADGF
jgi:hypothetical protein